MKRLPFAFATLAMAVVHVGGVLAMPRIPPGPETFSAALIQGNSPQEALEAVLTTEKAEALFDAHLALTRKAREAGAGLIIWPEYTVPLCFSCDDPLYRKLKNELEGFVWETGASLLIGTVEAAGREQGRAEYFNTALGLSRDRAATKYAKMHLVPFGEYLPYRGVLGFVGKLAPAVGGMAAGKSYTLHSFHEIPFASPICYEIIFPDLVRRFVKKGARFLVTITNDGWYGKSAALQQHFAAAAFRAVENRRFLLRAATTGISGIIDPAGRVLRQTEIGTRTLLVGDVTPVTARTFYTRHGDVFSFLALAVSGLFLLLTFIPTSKKRPQ
jgi:apolipoprotein N-acyltransferase